MIFKKFFTIEYFYQNTFNEINQHYKFLNEKNLIFPNESFFIFNNQQPALYCFQNKTINIPKNFFKQNINYLQFSSIQQFFKNGSLQFIIKHEVGHLNHHEWLLSQNNQTLNSKSNYIKTNTLVDKLLNRISTKDNSIDDFIHINFTESYADAYAGLTSYLYDQKIDIFENIIKFRSHNLTSLKEDKYFNHKLNQNNSSTLEITAGKFSTSRYSNILISDYIKHNIANNFLFEQLNSLTIDNLHALLQIEVLKSLNQTLKNEINSNPLFSNDFHKYLVIKNISVATYFNQFEAGIKEYQNKIILNLIHSSFINKNSPLLTDFIDFHINNSFKIYPFKAPLLHPIDESLISSLILEHSSAGNKINHLNFSKFITNKYILPISEFDSFMSYLEQKSMNNPKFNEIIKSLDAALIKSLINYNNLPLNNTPTPTLISYSQKELTSIITENLSQKDKKTFTEFISKKNIKEITTAYLSSSDFNVANNNFDEKQFQSKPASEILSRIIAIENKTKPHNEGNQNEVQKIKIK